MVKDKPAGGVLANRLLRLLLRLLVFRLLDPALHKRATNQEPVTFKRTSLREKRVSRFDLGLLLACAVPAAAAASAAAAACAAGAAAAARRFALSARGLGVRLAAVCTNSRHEHEASAGVPSVAGGLVPVSSLPAPDADVVSAPAPAPFSPLGRAAVFSPVSAKM